MGNHYTAKQFITAIPGTGGIIREIANRVGCAWDTAKKYIDTYPTINRAWQNERNLITDQARSNILGAIEQDKDIQTSKWWLTIMDDEFRPPQQIEHSGRDGEPIQTKTYIMVSPDDWPAPD